MSLILQYNFGKARPNLLTRSQSLINQTSDAYGFASFSLGTGFLKNNTTYTLTICGYTSQAANTNSYLRTYVYDAAWSYQTWSVPIYSQKECLTTLTFTTGSNATSYNYCIASYHFPSGSAGQGNYSTVKWYKLEEGSTSTAFTAETAYTHIGDNSGNNRHATSYGCSLVSDTKINSLALNTQDSGYAQLPSLSLSSTFTICGWVKFVGSFATWARVFDFGSVANGGDYAIGLATNSTAGNLCVFGRTGGGASLPDTTLSFTAALDTWYHYAIVLNGTNLKVYWDGALVAEWTIAKSLAATYTLNYLGKSNWADPYSRKYMSDFRVYDNALSADDILRLIKQRAAIDKIYSMHGYNFLEQTSNKMDITKTGIVGASEFVEYSNAKAIPDTNYERLEYLQFTGAQFINTGITSIPAPYTVRVKYNKTNTNTSDQNLFGQRQLGKFANIYGGYYETVFGVTSSGTESGDSQIHTIKTDSTSGFYKDNVLILSGKTGSASSSYPGLIGAFSEDSAANAKWFYSGNIYELKITSARKLFRHFVPAKRKSDGVLGMYELVTKSFFTNSGSGTFGAGTSILSTCLDLNVAKYEQLEYIQSSGTQQINTGVYFDMENDFCQVDFCSTVLNQNGMIFASNNSTNYFWFYHYSGTSAFSVYISANSQVNVGNRSWDTQKHRMRYHKKKYYIDTTYCGTDTRSLPVTDYPIYLFSWGDNYFYHGRIFGCKIWKKGILTRDFIPVRRKSDGVLGMYDRVTNGFYTNSGSGSFTAGPTIKQLDYLSINELKEDM